MTLGEVIAEYRVNHSLSMDKFAELSGLSKAYISMLEKNRTQRGKEPSPSIDVYRSVAAALGISVDELIRKVDGKISLFPSNLAPMPKTSKAPRLGSIACGEPILAEQNIEGYDDVPDYVKCDFTLLCKGDSMTGARIYDGDIVCIKQQEEAQNGQIAAVLVDGEFETEATLKRVRLLKDGIALWPENPAYEPWIFTGEDANRVHIIGIATHFISVAK